MPSYRAFIAAYWGIFESSTRLTISGNAQRGTAGALCGQSSGRKAATLTCGRMMLTSTHVFVVADQKATAKVSYHGDLPDLFREGQGIVAEGTFDADGTFVAKQVLAKHDERYMPRDVAKALKKQGEWRGDGSGEPAYKGSKP